MNTLTNKELTLLPNLLTKILHEQVEPGMIEHVPANSWPASVITALKKDPNDVNLVFDIGQNDVRPIVIKAITELCTARMKELVDSQSLPLRFVLESSNIFRIQDAGHSSSVFYAYGTGRYNCPHDHKKVMYCGDYPDTCLAEKILRESNSKGLGPASKPFSRKSEWFGRFDLGAMLTARELKLLDVPALKAQLNLSGKLTLDDYLWTHGIVAAISALDIDVDGISYESSHLGHGRCYALFQTAQDQLKDQSLTKLSECEVESSLLVRNEYTLGRDKVAVKDIFTKVLGGVITDND